MFNVRRLAYHISPWWSWLMPAAVAGYDVATPSYEVATVAYLLPCAAAVTITTTAMTERHAARRVDRQLGELAAKLAEVHAQAPVDAAARLAMQAAMEAFGAANADQLPAAVGDDGPTHPIRRRPQLVHPTPINGSRRRD